MKLINNASTLEYAEKSLENFEEKWSKNAPAAVASWKNNWACLSTFFDFHKRLEK
jgi:putative transposase